MGAICWPSSERGGGPLGLKTAYLIPFLFVFTIAACGGEEEKGSLGDNPDLDELVVQELKDQLQGLWIGPCNPIQSGFRRLKWSFSNKNTLTLVISEYGPGGCREPNSISTWNKSGSYGITDVEDKDTGTMQVELKAPHWEESFVDFEVNLSISGQQMGWTFEQATKYIQGRFESVDESPRFLDKNNLQ